MAYQSSERSGEHDSAANLDERSGENAEQSSAKIVDLHSLFESVDGNLAISSHYAGIVDEGSHWAVKFLEVSHK